MFLDFWVSSTPRYFFFTRTSRNCMLCEQSRAEDLVCQTDVCMKVFILVLGDYGISSCSRTRQIIRYRVTATLRRSQIKQYTALNERVLQIQQDHHIILTKYEEVQNLVAMTLCASSLDIIWLIFLCNRCLSLIETSTSAACSTSLSLVFSAWITPQTKEIHRY